MAFAFLKGDVTGPQAADIPSVFWSKDYFHQMNQLRVCTQLALAADPAIAIVEPFVPADAGKLPTCRPPSSSVCLCPAPVYRFASGGA
jgi:hypothetical protein